ncbi:MAG: type II toxin-antitoxin system RelE/ParE family toxin [Alphaproteobacteria bacterium]|nr:type II toxin-antitoxin system RelE/ParE family toxin [Alphaproteobacteria bacterium]
MYNYTAGRWGLTQAETYIGELRDVCHELADGVRKGRDVGSIRAGYRKQICGSHFVFYRTTVAGLEIVRILHQRMNVEFHL